VSHQGVRDGQRHIAMLNDQRLGLGKGEHQTGVDGGFRRAMRGTAPLVVSLSVAEAYHRNRTLFFMAIVMGLASWATVGPPKTHSKPVAKLQFCARNTWKAEAPARETVRYLRRLVRNCEKGSGAAPPLRREPVAD
jgi:hypothetical protein